MFFRRQLAMQRDVQVSPGNKAIEMMIEACKMQRRDLVALEERLSMKPGTEWIRGSEYNVDITHEYHPPTVRIETDDERFQREAEQEVEDFLAYREER